MKWIAVLILLLLCGDCKSQKWSAGIFFGFPYNFPLPLVIEQSDYPDLKIKSAIYATHPLRSPQFYGVYLKYEKWIVEMIHHKIYLRNKPPEIQYFAVSHGYNLLTLSQKQNFPFGYLVFGGGMVIVHPENTIRNMKYEEKGGIFNLGYHINGITLSFTAGKTLLRKEKVKVNSEVKFVPSYSEIPVVLGKAKVYQAFIVLGLGIEVGKN
jgi:hypothetical protein